MSEIESTTDKCIENGSSKEECQKSTNSAKIAFNENQKNRSKYEYHRTRI